MVYAVVAVTLVGDIIYRVRWRSWLSPCCPRPPFPPTGLGDARAQRYGIGLSAGGWTNRHMYVHAVVGCSGITSLDLSTLTTVQSRGRVGGWRIPLSIVPDQDVGSEPYYVVRSATREGQEKREQRERAESAERAERQRQRVKNGEERDEDRNGH